MAESLLSNPASTKKDLKTTHGSCLCKAIQYTLTGHPSTTVLCHCISCKKASGSTFAANGFYETSVLPLSPSLFSHSKHSQQLTITSSTSSLRTYEDHSCDAGGFVLRSFCGECGSPIFTKNPKFESAVIVMSGTMDYEKGDLRGWKPRNEFYCKRRGGWLDGVGAEEGERFEGMS